MNGRGQYGRNYIPLRTTPNLWGTPNLWRAPIFVGAGVPAPVAAPPPAAATIVVPPAEKGVTVGSIFKYGAIGALVIGGALAASSLFTTVKKGKEPVRYYTDLYRGKAR